MKQREALSLPSDRPYTGKLSALIRKRWRLLCLFCLPPVAGCVWRFADFGLSLPVPLLLGLTAGFACWHTLVARITNANSYIYHRWDHPVGYWCTCIIELLMYFGIVAAIWLAPAPSAQGTPSAKPDPQRISTP